MIRELRLLRWRVNAVCVGAIGAKAVRPHGPGELHRRTAGTRQYSGDGGRRRLSRGALERCLDRVEPASDAKLVCVTGMTPTRGGEGNTTTVVSLTDGLAGVGRRAVACLRQASLGPVFGIKGGAAGGGRAQVVPMEELNLHFTGDIHAIGAAHNLLAAMIDASLLHGNPHDIDGLRVPWRRALDMNDRALRRITIGLGGKANGYPRETGFDITAASEVMAIAAVARDLRDLRRRLGRITAGYSREDGKPVTAEDLRTAGAMAVLLKDALKPNLVQTLEGQPALVHCGPLGITDHGNNSLIADLIALRLAEYAVTECGFGSDMGMEKFFNLVCRVGNLTPAAAVLVVSIRAVRHHGGLAEDAHAGRRARLNAVEVGMAPTCDGTSGSSKPSACPPSSRSTGEPTIRTRRSSSSSAWRSTPARSRPASTTDLRGEEPGQPNWPRQSSRRAKSPPGSATYTATMSRSRTRWRPWRGGCTAPGMCSVWYPEAEQKLTQFTREGLAGLPVCIAKTHLSLSADPSLLNAPEGFTLPVRDIRAYTGAGWLVPLCGEITQMPGLGKTPGAAGVDIDAEGRTVGLF